MAEPYINVLSVAPLDDYRLAVSLSNGKRGVYDVSPLLNRGVFRKLRDRHFFAQVRICFSGVGWPGGLDISPFAIDDELRPLRKGESAKRVPKVEPKIMRRYISRFGGMRVFMPYPQSEKCSPRIVAEYGGDRAEVAIKSGRRLSSDSLPPEKFALLKSWMQINRENLIANGQIAQNGNAPFPVAPLSAKIAASEKRAG